MLYSFLTRRAGDLAVVLLNEIWQFYTLIEPKIQGKPKLAQLVPLMFAGMTFTIFDAVATGESIYDPFYHE